MQESVCIVTFHMRKVQVLRTETGMSRRELADATGIPLRSIAAYERGVAIPLGRAALIASAFGVPIDALIDRQQLRNQEHKRSRP